MKTFVSVGNATQPFERLLSGVTDILKYLPAPVFIQHGNTPFSCPDCETQSFVGMADFSIFIEQAELLIIHGGAGSVIHAIRAGKVPVVMPRRQKYGEHVDDHQVELSLELAKTKRIVVAMERSDLMRAIEAAMALQRSIDVSHPPSQLVELVRTRLEAYDSEKRPDIH